MEVSVSNVFLYIFFVSLNILSQIIKTSLSDDDDDDLEE